jgi:hypothetical protein
MAYGYQAAVTSLIFAIVEPFIDPPQSGVESVSNEEPEYLKALKRRQEQQKAGAPKSAAPSNKKSPPTPAEREAIRWAQEVGGKEVVISSTMSGARCAVLLHPITTFGKPRITLEGVADRDALAARLNAAVGSGENVLGCYEITTGRVLTANTVEGKTTFTAGPPRAVPKAESPERMIRRATAEAELLAKTRKVDDGRGGRGGGGGRGR